MIGSIIIKLVYILTIFTLTVLVVDLIKDI
jgi:hypothetical protein